MSLTDLSIRNAKPQTKPYKLADGGGLHLLAHPSGARYWRLKYRYAGKEKGLALRVYPRVGAKAARQAASTAKAQLE